MKHKFDDKLNQAYSCKNVALKVEDIDEGNRIVKGYFASFDTIDSDFDVIRKGAFAKSIKERGVDADGNRRIAHLRNHDWDRQVGKLLELYEDDKGLVFVSQLGRSTEGKDALYDYQDGILREHSIGFNYIGDKMKFIEDSEMNDNGHYDIHEVKLWEGSGVTFGSNSLTPVIDAAKSTGNFDDLISKIQSLEESFMKALKNGKGTDGRLENIELKFKQIQQLRNSLYIAKPFDKNTLKDAKPKDTAKKDDQLFDDQKKLFINLIKQL